MVEEYSALISNHIWDLVLAQSGLNFISSKLAYKVKYCSYGNVERYKACLIA